MCSDVSVMRCTACSSASDLNECLAKYPVNCNWLTVTQTYFTRGGVCVGWKDGLNKRYPYFISNQQQQPRSVFQCSYPLQNQISCKACVDNGCVFQSSFIST